MKTAVLLFALVYQQSQFTDAPAGWSTWSARPEIAPRTFVDRMHSRGGEGSLAISGNSNASAHGGWEKRVDGVGPGKWYRLTAHYLSDGVAHEARQIVARISWERADGKRAGQPDYAWQTTDAGNGWKRVVHEAPAPENGSAAKIELLLSNAPAGTVYWDDIQFEEIAAPKPRNVTVAAINLRPRNTKSAAESVRQFLATVDKTATKKLDVILLPEGITVVGTGLKYADVAESIPGPTTAALAETARKHQAWVVAGIYEREGNTIYNTSVLLDRAGRVSGKYRKVYLPREEIEAGITPGSTYPVFDTDFGRVGMMICYDSFYADPARALALNGAELILMPIWGGNQALVKARSIENRVFIATSGYDYPTHIQDPNGELLATASEQGSAAIATIDLNRRFPQEFLGEMRGRFMKELRLDVKIGRPGLDP